MTAAISSSILTVLLLFSTRFQDRSISRTMIQLYISIISRKKSIRLYLRSKTKVLLLQSKRLRLFLNCSQKLLKEKWIISKEHVSNTWMQMNVRKILENMMQPLRHCLQKKNVRKASLVRSWIFRKNTERSLS